MIEAHEVVVFLTVTFTLAGFAALANKSRTLALTLFALVIAMFWGYYLGDLS